MDMSHIFMFLCMADNFDPMLDIFNSAQDRDPTDHLFEKREKGKMSLRLAHIIVWRECAGDRERSRVRTEPSGPPLN